MNGTIEINDDEIWVFGGVLGEGSIELPILPTQDWMPLKHGDVVEFEIFDIGVKQYAQIITGQIQMSYEYYINSIQSILLLVKQGLTDNQIMESAIKIAEEYKINQ